MQGSIVQVLSLAIHGNAALRGWTNASFFSDNSSCKFCKSISFILLEPDPKQPSEVNFSNNPDEWFARQAARGAAGYRVSWEPRHPGPKASDRMLVGLVGGGGHWRLETLFADSFESWEP